MGIAKIEMEGTATMMPRDVDKKILNNLFDAILKKDTKNIAVITDKIFAVGRNINAVIKDLLEIIKDEYINKNNKEIMTIYKAFAELEMNIKTAVDARSMFEGVCLLCTV